MYPPTAVVLRRSGSSASAPPPSLATPPSPSASPSITPSAAAGAPSVLVRKAGSSAVGTSYPRSASRLEPPIATTPRFSQGRLVPADCEGDPGPSCPDRAGPRALAEHLEQDQPERRRRAAGAPPHCSARRGHCHSWSDRFVPIGVGVRHGADRQDVPRPTDTRSSTATGFSVTPPTSAAATPVVFTHTEVDHDSGALRPGQHAGPRRAGRRPQQGRDRRPTVLVRPRLDRAAPRVRATWSGLRALTGAWLTARARRTSRPAGRRSARCGRRRGRGSRPRPRCAPRARRRPRSAARPASSQRSGSTLIAMWCSPPSTSAYGPDVQAGEVEEGQQVAVADVEEEVRGAGVVAVLDQLGQREAEHVLVEADRPLDVAADQRGVVQAAGGRRRPLAGGRRCASRMRSRSAAIAARSGLSVVLSVVLTGRSSRAVRLLATTLVRSPCFPPGFGR